MAESYKEIIPEEVPEEELSEIQTKIKNAFRVDIGKTQSLYRLI